MTTSQKNKIDKLIAKADKVFTIAEFDAEFKMNAVKRRIITATIQEQGYYMGVVQSTNEKVFVY